MQTGYTITSRCTTRGMVHFRPINAGSPAADYEQPRSR